MSDEPTELTEEGITQPLKVKVEREIPMPWFKLLLDNNHSEELEPEECRKWFRDRGANMQEVEYALDYVWNFGMYKPVYVIIHDPKEIKILQDNVIPNI